MLKGRLGLAKARVPYRDRHGLMWLGRGQLAVREGTLHFTTAGFGDLPAGDYDIAYQMVTCVLLGPGSTVSHDALRLLGVAGVFFAGLPFFFAAGFFVPGLGL